MEKKIIEKIENNKVVIIDHIFLPKMTTILSMLDFKILVKCDNDLRIERILERDKISIEYLQKREQTAIEYNEPEYDRVIDSEELTCLIK
jgi:uridine kinase